MGTFSFTTDVIIDIFKLQIALVFVDDIVIFSRSTMETFHTCAKSPLALQERKYEAQALDKSVFFGNSRLSLTHHLLVALRNSITDDI